MYCPHCQSRKITEITAAAEVFFKQAEKTTGITLEKITTDKEPALYPAIENVFVKSTKHRDVKYLNNRIEQYH